MFYKNVIFYNLYGTGDLWSSREFVKRMMDVIPAFNFHYAHTKDHHLFFDFPTLSYHPIDNYCDMRQPYVIIGESLYINTWIGYAYGKYVFPGVSVTLENMKRMFNDTLKSMGVSYKFEGTDYFYVPEPNYDFLDDEFVTNIDNFIFGNVAESMALISNGDVWSNQAENFDFRPIIDELARKYMFWKFIITEDYASKPTNVYYCKDIIQKSCGSDLPEISYLSSYMDVLIGRSSGPFVFAQTKQNYSNEHMKIISFTHERACGHMINQAESSANLFWSKSADYKSVLEDIEPLFYGDSNE